VSKRFEPVASPVSYCYLAERGAQVRSLFITRSVFVESEWREVLGGCNTVGAPHFAVPRNWCLELNIPSQ